MSIKAHIKQDDLMKALDRADEAYSAILANELAEDDKEVQKFIEKHKKGMFWWKRDFTKDEAISKMNYTGHWYFKSTQTKYDISEIQYLRNMLKSEKLYDIVLNKYQLELLKDYL